MAKVELAEEALLCVGGQAVSNDVMAAAMAASDLSRNHGRECTLPPYFEPLTSWGKGSGSSVDRSSIESLENGDMTLTFKRRLLEKAYAAFNARDLDGGLAAMHADVDWPTGMEGGSVHGHGGVRDYWTRQWALIDSHVEPLRFETDEDGRIVVHVHQVVRNLDGNIMVDEMVRHAYVIEDGLVRSMEIQAP